MITEYDFINQVELVLTLNDLPSNHKKIVYLSKKIYNSGCIDIEQLKINDLSIAKAVAHVIFKKIANELKPLNNTNEIKNIEKFI